MKTTIKNILLSSLLVVCCGAAAGVTAYKVCSKSVNQNTVAVPVPANSYNAVTTAMSGTPSQPVDLTEAAEKTIHGVVHIKSTVKSRIVTQQIQPDIFDYFFGNGRPRQRQYQTEPQTGIGSGVIISDDGYIVTNNHVIEGADEIEVKLNDNRIFQATVVGADPGTDLALIKIDGDKFPTIPMGDSDQLKVGEWVLAVGNPFNLTSTVTAGVVSAKARRIGIYGGESVESFIQTDAAINMGNSGGALVNTRGELIGINSALESPTGTYAGYGFAIPTTIVRKVVADIKEFGSVQRALLGIMGSDVAEMRQLEENKDKDFGSLDGVYVSEVTDGGGALAAGLKKGDIITEINGKPIKTMTELQEMVAQFRPGDTIKVTYLRDKKQKKLDVTLKNSRGDTKMMKNEGIEALGAAFKEVPEQLRRQLNIGYGMQVSAVNNGKLKDAGIQRGFIILKINNQQIKSEADIEAEYEKAVKSPEQVLFITGVYQSGRRANFAVDLSADEE